MNGFWRDIKRASSVAAETGDIVHATSSAYFRITQTQQKLERHAVSNQQVAIDTHFDVGRKVRQAMERISGTQPEDLPAEPSLKRSKKGKAAKDLLDE